MVKAMPFICIGVLLHACALDQASLNAPAVKPARLGLKCYMEDEFLQREPFDDVRGTMVHMSRRHARHL